MANTLTEEQQNKAVSILKTILLESGEMHECDQEIHDFLFEIGEDVSTSYLNLSDEEEV